MASKPAVPTFTSSEIADEMAKVFGDKAKTVEVDIKYRKEVGDFVLKIEHAHQNAGNTNIRFKRPFTTTREL